MAQDLDIMHVTWHEGQHNYNRLILTVDTEKSASTSN